MQDSGVCIDSIMCGINGVLAFRSALDPKDHDELHRVSARMAHRGPDDYSAWCDNTGHVAFAHRRLSIIDLSERGRQPFLHKASKAIIIYNGELYNYRLLREGLEQLGHHFFSESDTEVVIALYAEYGLAMFERMRGMFALAIWDPSAGRLLLARDPYGIKPLYWGVLEGRFYFSSELKPLIHELKHTTFSLNQAAVDSFFIFGSVQDPETIVNEFNAVPAGHYLQVSPNSAPTISSYFDIASTICTKPLENVTAATQISRIRDAVYQSVEAHLLSDVDIGVFLSGGIDSGTLLAIASELSPRKLTAITLRFAEAANTVDDETDAASQIAEYYGVDHVIRTIDRDEFKYERASFFMAMDQPSIDGLNSWFVSKATREAGLKVALHGAGGDELFWGYRTFRDVDSWVRFFSALPLTKSVGRVIRVLFDSAQILKNSPKASSLMEYGGTLPGAYVLRRGLFLPHQLQRLHECQNNAEKRSAFDALSYLTKLIDDNEATRLKKIAVLESLTYLKNQLLRDADWTGMAHSLEIRTPLTDPWLTRQLSDINHSFIGNRGKRALARIPTRPLPQNIREAKKRSFTVPLKEWMALPSTQNASRGVSAREWARVVMDEYLSSISGRVL